MLNYYGQRSHGKTKDSELNGGLSLVGNLSHIFEVVQNMKQVMHYQTIKFTPFIRVFTNSIWPIAGEHFKLLTYLLTYSMVQSFLRS